MIQDFTPFKTLKNRIAGREGVSVFFILITTLLPLLSISQNTELPVRRSIFFNGEEREYFIHSPLPETAEKYWLLIVVHGGGGNGRNYFLTDGLKTEIEKEGLNVLIVAPSFSNKDVMSSRFPAIGEGDFLKTIICELNQTFSLHKNFFLTGYSRGAQFSHRFAFQNPELVKACAAFAAGTWSTPEGSLLIEGIGEISDPENFLSSSDNKDKVPKRLQNMFDPRVVRVAGEEACKGADKVPFLVMCGRMDPRFEIAQQFAHDLEEGGFRVKTKWTNNPHGEKEKYRAEFEKYSKEALRFFKSEINTQD